MEFWGVEVPAGKPTSCSPGDGMYLHVSQAALGESKDKSGKKIERVVVRVEVDDSEVVLGTLSEGKCDQMPLDLVFDREFKISHNSNYSSVFICGYRTEGPDDFYDSEDEDDEEDEEEKSADVPAAVAIASNGDASGKHAKVGKHEKATKPSTESAISKAASTAADAITKAISKNLKKSQIVQDDESEEDDESEDDSDEDEELGHPFVSDLASESDDEFDAGSDEDMDDEDDDEEDDEDDDEFDSDESDEEELMVETPKSGKKRAAVGVPKAAVSEKKSKVDIASKPGPETGSGKKGAKAGPVAPSAKSPATKEAKTPKDAKQHKATKVPKGTPTTAPPTPTSEKKLGPHKCTGCEKTFTTESAKTQHMVAKHKA